MQSSPQTPELQRTKGFVRPSRARRWLRRVAIVIIALVIAILAAPHALSWIISYKLRSEIAGRLHARLELGKVTYLWPYGVRIENARLTTTSGETDQVPLFDVGRIELTLAKMPLSSGPLVIQNIEIQDPLVHLIRTKAGLAGTDVINQTPATNEAPTKSAQRMSDFFELRRLTLSGGRVEYEDRSKPRPLSPVVWNNLQADLRTTPTGVSNYQFQFSVKNDPVADIEAAGDMDIDTLLLNVSRLSIAVQTDVDKPAEQLSPQIQAICRKFSVGGKVTVNAIARIPLRDANQGVYAAEISLQKGSCKLPNLDLPLSLVELTLACGNSTAGAFKTLPTTLPDRAPDTQLSLSGLKIASGNQIFQIDNGNGTMNQQDGTWSFEHIGGLAELGDGPGPIGKAGVLAHLPFSATGTGEFSSGMFLLRVGIDGASASFVPKKLPLNQITASMTITPDGLRLINLAGNTCGGQLTLHGDANLNDSATGPAYNGNVSITNLDMRQVANFLLPDEKSRQMASGVGELHLQVSGNIPLNSSALDAIKAKGDFDIQRGHFVDIPVLKDVLANVKEADAATVGEAAATFTIAHSRINFEQAAASAPAVGVLGHGGLGFDGTVNMSFIVTPLADWREKLAKTDVPILNSFGAMVVGKVQKAVNTAENAALYQYRVTGTLSNPQTEQVPAPVLTDAMKPLFQKMSGNRKDDDMSKELRQRQQQGP